MLRMTMDDRTSNVVQGIAELLPFRSNTFEMLTMGYALRHVEDLTSTFREYLRVLKPGGVLLVLEIIPPPSGLTYYLVKWCSRPDGLSLGYYRKLRWPRWYSPGTPKCRF